MAALPAHWAPKTTGSLKTTRLPKTTGRSSFPSVGRMKLRDNDEDASSFSETTGRERRRRSGDGGGNFAQQQQQQQRMWWWLPRQKGRFLFYSNGVILLVVLLLSLSLFGVRAEGGESFTKGEVDELRTLLNEQGIDDDPRKIKLEPAQAEYWREFYFYPKKTMDRIEKAQKGLGYASLPSMAAGGGMLAAGEILWGRKHASKARSAGLIIMVLGGLAGAASLLLKDVAREKRIKFNEKRESMQRIVAQKLGW